MEEFVACFAEVVDPRRDNARHDLHELLMIALCTLLSGGEDCSDMALFGEIKAPYLRQFLRLRHGTPSHDTFSRVFRLLDPKDVYGEDFPSETFRVLKEKELRLYGEYRTRRLVLEKWDSMYV